MSTVHRSGFDWDGQAVRVEQAPYVLDGSPLVRPSHGALRPLGLDEVEITGGFLGALQERNRSATLPHIEAWLERSGWLPNFDAAVAGRLPQDRRGREFSDSEVYKLLEALAWEFGRTGDPAIDERFRAIAERVIAAQEPDGYLNTRFGRPGQAPRYSDLEWGHELYCFGHLIQAGVARARTVGNDEFVQAVRRAADHVCATFGPHGLHAVCGHPEIEPALVELFRVTGERRYLDQARLFVERRGHQVLDDVEFGRAYFQDDVPVRAADVLRGHAVRALYLSAGAVDVATETADAHLTAVLSRQWRNTVSRRTYLTGGMGSHHQDEAFGTDFELPSDRAYSETCAGVGSIMFAWRLLLAEGGADYADLIERTLYNVVAASPSADGTRFFYVNTLHQRELGSEPDPDEMIERAHSHLRGSWYSVSCCPPNVARTVAGLAGYLATADDTGVQLHQYAPSTVATTLSDGRAVQFRVETRYPVDGRIVITTTGPQAGPWTLSLRIPGWARRGSQVRVSGGDRTEIHDGYARITRDFHPGDTVELVLPMQPRFTTADPRVDAVRGCRAVERGPEVYCLESVDTPDHDHVDRFRLVGGAPTEVDGTVRVALERLVADDQQHGSPSWPYDEPAAADDEVPPVRSDRTEVVLRPYREWGNRGPATMRVWLPL